MIPSSWAEVLPFPSVGFRLRSGFTFVVVAGTASILACQALYPTMKQAMWMAVSIAVNVAELKNHLSEHLDAVEKGEELVICRRNIPFARITAMPLRRNRTKLGLQRGQITIRGDITGPAAVEADWNALRDDHEPLT